MDASVLYALFTYVGIAGLIGCVIFCALLVHEVTGRLIAPMTNRRSPEPALTRSGQRRTVSWLWTSPLPGATAVLTAIVTTPLTRPIAERQTEGKLWFGLVLAVCALMGAAGSVLVLMRRGNGAADVARRWRTDVLAALIWLVALVVMVPSVLPMLIDTFGRSITDKTVMALVLVPCPAWILLRRGNRRLHRNGARPGAGPLPTQQH